MRTLILLAGFLVTATTLLAQPATGYAPAAAQALVARTMANELREAGQTTHPMRYLLRKQSTNLTTTKEIFESRDGAVARLRAVSDRPLTPDEEQREQARLEALLRDPSQQQHRRQNQEGDRSMALKIMRLLPTAYLYQDAGTGQGPDGPVVRFSFHPNPAFNPSDMISQALVTMHGTITIDPAQERMVHLEGRLQEDTNYGWGILGKLDKGGWLALDQTDVGGHQWRIVHFAMRMNLRIVWKNRALDTVEDFSHYTPVPPGTEYAKAIQLLRSEPISQTRFDPSAAKQATRP